MKDNIYTESQTFFTKWLVILLVVVFMSFFLFTNEAWNEWSTERIIAFTVLVVVALLLYVMRLKTRIDADGISIQFIPFIWNKTWKWDEIIHLEVSKYTILDYGGWGYRIGKSGIAYTTKGSFGIKMTFAKGMNVLIGTQNPEEVKAILSNLKPNQNEKMD